MLVIIYRKISSCSRNFNRSRPPNFPKIDKSLQIWKPPIEAAGRLLRFLKDQNFFQPKTYLRLPVSWKDNDQVLIRPGVDQTCR